MRDETDPHLWYMQQVIAWQPRLYAFILSLTSNPNEADDILQNANMAILQKEGAFLSGANFSAWAMQIAFFEVQRHRDRLGRESRRFDDTLLDRLASKWEPFNNEPGIELQMLRQCMSLLSDQEREILALRYDGDTLGAIAEKYGRPAGSISQTLYRIRVKLAECIKRAIRAESRDES
jgi:RNA polymerase sigma-70 factor, ECF subfamily